MWLVPDATAQITGSVLYARSGIIWSQGQTIAYLVIHGVRNVPQTTIMTFVRDVLQVIISISKTPGIRALMTAKIRI